MGPDGQAKQNQPQAKKTKSGRDQNKKPVIDSEKGQSRDAVGEKGGVSGLTAERSAFYVRVMDALEAVERGRGGVTLCYLFALSSGMVCLDDQGGRHEMATQRPSG